MRKDGQRIDLLEKIDSWIDDNQDELYELFKNNDLFNKMRHSSVNKTNTV